MLQGDKVSFGYGVRTLVLDDVSLSVESSSLIGILGPNGSGKTTLLKLLAGMLRPTGGSVRLDGREISSLPRAAVARRCAVVPQETHLAFEYSVMEIVLMGRYPHLGAFEVERPDDLAAAEAALAATGTRHLADRAFNTLSGGEKQRVIIASALAQLDAAGSRQPAAGRLLLLDEPTTSLDLRYQIEIAQLIRRLHAERGVAIVLSTHDLDLAGAICREVVLLAGGRVLAQGPADEMLTSARIAELYDLAPEQAAELAVLRRAPRPS